MYRLYNRSQYEDRHDVQVEVESRLDVDEGDGNVSTRLDGQDGDVDKTLGVDGNHNDENPVTRVDIHDDVSVVVRVDDDDTLGDDGVMVVVKGVPGGVLVGMEHSRSVVYTPA